MKILLAAISTAALAAIVFMSTDQSSGLAAVITSMNSDVQSCIEKLNSPKVTLQKDQYTITRVHIDTDGAKDILVRNEAKEFCGSAGCIHEICLVGSGEVQSLNFSLAAETLTIENSISNQMHDIQLEGKGNVSMEWDGMRYTIK